MSKKVAVESEIGSLTVILNTEFNQRLQPKERILSYFIKGAITKVCSSSSYRECCDILNLFLHKSEENAFHHRTINDFINRFGDKATTLLLEKSSQIFSSYGFNPITGLPYDIENIPANICNITQSSDEITDQEWIKFLEEKSVEYNKNRPDDEQFSINEVAALLEKPSENVCMVSIDDVGVRHQKEHRLNGGKKTQKVVENTVIHVQSKGRAYVLTAI